MTRGCLLLTISTSRSWPIHPSDTTTSSGEEDLVDQAVFSSAAHAHRVGTESLEIRGVDPPEAKPPGAKVAPGLWTPLEKRYQVKQFGPRSRFPENLPGSVRKAPSRAVTKLK